MGNTLIVGNVYMLQYAGIYFWVLIVAMISIMLYAEKKNNGKERQIINFKSQLYYTDVRSGWNIGKVSNLFGYLSFVFLIWSVLAIIHMYTPQYCNSILKHIDAIESVIIAYIAVVISVIIFSVTLAPKDYYLTRTRGEVNRQFKIHIIFQVLAICTVVSVVSYVLLLMGNLDNEVDYLIFSMYEICCIGILGGGLYGLIIIGILTLGSSRVELCSLNKLYEKFWDKSALKLVNQTDDVIYVNLEYLLKRYSKLTYIKSKKMRNIYQIEYITNADNDAKWQKKTIICISKFLMVILIISIVSLIVNKNYIWMIIIIILYGASFSCLFVAKFRNIIAQCCVDIVLDNSGFLIKNKEDNNKDVYIGLVSLVYDIAGRRYINSICNLMALYCIICSCWKKKQYQKIADSFEGMIEYIETVAKGREGMERALLFLPVFLCGYYYHINFLKKEFPKEIVQLYASFNLTPKEKKQYYVTLNSFILYASRNRASKKDYEEIKHGKCDEEYCKKYIEINGYSQLFEGLKY